MTSEIAIDLPAAARAEWAFRQLARRQVGYFIKYTYPPYSLTPFHTVYNAILTRFARGDLKKLIVSVPPQHGKSLASTRSLPAFMLGHNPELRVAVVSYSTDKARRFGRQIRGVMDSDAYKRIFSGVRLPEAREANYTNSSDIVDILGGAEKGNLFLTGRGGGLTGDPVDILIMDDMYKNASEANSPVIRQNIIDWYNMVGDSRLHNDSQQLIVFTRWHDQDLVGYIQKTEGVVMLESFEQLDNIDPDQWYMINFEALKESAPTELDPRQEGEALFPEKHSAKKLNRTKKRLLQGDAENWRCLYQGDPRPITGLLYGQGFQEYERGPAEVVERLAYIDTADQGKDWLCAIAYDKGADNFLYLKDVYYTPEPAEITEEGTAQLLITNNTDRAIFESNAGGRAFSRNVERILRERGNTCIIEAIPTTQNKESRIITGAASCMRSFLMPINWAGRFPAFAGDLLGFRKLFQANARDDAPDALQGAYEKSGLDGGLDIVIIGV